MPTLFTAPQKTVQPNKHFSPENQPSTRMGPLTAFAVNPKKIRFETQEEAENVILFLRQHIIVNVPWILLTLLLVLTPTLIFPKLFELLRVNVELPASYFVVGTMFWYLATFGFALASFIKWFFNIYIVTNERIVDIDFLYLLYKKFSQAELTKVQDINYTSGGILATIFNYGNVVVETAGEAPNIDFLSIPYPEKVVETIRELTESEATESV